MEVSAEPQSIPGFQLPLLEDGTGVALRDSLLAALAYADLFDYPLTVDELVCYQPGTTFTPHEIRESLRTDESLRSILACSRGYWSLRDHPDLAQTRLDREIFSGRLWRRAIIYSRWVSNMPFVRMVAVTGALSMHNAGPVSDIDLLVVAQAGRVWLCRRALILCVRIARLFGDDLCPNYVVAENNLELDQRDLYTAHELAQMVPMSGLSVYRAMLKANEWAAAYLPAAFGTLDLPIRHQRPRAMQRPLELLLGLRPFDVLERWELRRMQAKLRPALGSAAEVVCSPEQCKGHTGLHRQSVLERYEQRLKRVRSAY